MKILITGASGYIGKALSNKCIEENHEVYGLTRSLERNQKENPFIKWIEWTDTAIAPDLSSIDQLDAVINLMGESLVGKRWNADQKKILFDSRVVATRSLIKGLENSKLKAPKFISTSAIGIYGDQGETELTEDSAQGSDYTANLCQQWENAALEASSVSEVITILRLGIVISKESHFLKKLLPIFKLGLGGNLGNGKFYMSWIHLDDLVQMFMKAISSDCVKGIYNAVAPFPEKNKDLTTLIAKRLGKKAIFHVPKFAVKLGMGEVGGHILSSCRVVPAKMSSEKFYFKYPTLKLALKDSIVK